ncbi:MAG: metallophosphoesterase [Clostridia bacterium]|nr:metallophosphoesterase [Clostridia bacterium]
MNPITEKYTLAVGLPRAMTFAFVSDLHDCDNAPVLQAIEKSGADAVLVGGDFIHNDEIYRRGVEFLAQSAARRKTFCCIGNHERHYMGDLAALIAPTGAVLLDNQAVEYGGIVIGGLSSGYAVGHAQISKRKSPLWRLRPTPPPDLDFLNRFSALKGYKLLLCHHPEYWARYIKPLPVDLTLSGHAHGGQWRFFGRGVFAPGQGIFPRYTSGLYHGRLLVGRGLGNPHHRVPRINNRPMVAVIKLK